MNDYKGFNRFLSNCFLWPVKFIGAKQPQKILIKIGIGQTPPGKKNSGDLDIIIPHDYIDLLAKFNIIQKDINHLNQFKQCTLNIMKPLYIEKINLQMQRQWYLNY